MAVLQAKVTTKGQITLPKAVREQLSIQTGDRIEFSVDESNTVTLSRLEPAGSSAGCGKQFLKPTQPKYTHAEEKELLAAEFAAKYGPKR